MEITKQTYKRINLFIGVAQLLLTKEIDGNKLSKDEKLSYALRRVLPKCNEAMNDYAEEVEDIKVELASVDEKGNLLRDGKEYRFTKDNQKKQIDKIRELFKTKEHEVPQCFAEAPDWLSDDIKEALQGFVLPNEPV